MPHQIRGEGSPIFLVKVDSNNALNVVGSVQAAVSVTTGSESVITAGSVEVYQNTATDLDVNIGNIGSVRTLQGTGSVVVSGTAIVSPVIGTGSMVISGTTIPRWRGVGSVVVSGTPTVTISTALPTGNNNIGNVDIVTQPAWSDVGSVITSGITSITGSVTIEGTGSVVTSGVSTVTGSITIYDSRTGSVGVVGSIEVFQQTATNLEVNATQVTDPWTVDGTVNLGTAFTGVGSVVISGTPIVAPTAGVGSVVISGTTQPVWRGTGSVVQSGTAEVWNSGVGFLVTGSIVSMPSITTSSDSVIAMGSQTLGSVNIIGGITDPNPGSAYPLRLFLGSALMIGGSVSTYSPVGVGSIIASGVTTITGSVTLYDSSTGSVHNIGSIGVYGPLGSLHTIGSTQIYGPTGSVHNIGSIEIHGTLATVTTITTANLGTAWTGVGSVVVSGTAVTSMVGTGSVVISGTTQPVWRGVGSTIASGVTTVTGSVTLEGIGSIRIAAVASDIVDPLQVEQNRGIFRFSGATIIGSVIGSYLISPGAGSKLLLKGFSASCEVATQFRIIYSGLVPESDGALVSTFSVPNSGTVAMNFMGMEPSGIVDLPIGVGLFNAGSVHITFFTEDTL